MPTLIISRKTIDSDITESIQGGVSQSEYGEYDLCHYKWYLSKVKMLTDKRPEFILSVGTSFHSGMDWMYRSAGKRIGVPPLEFNKFANLTPEEEQMSYYWHQILWQLTKGYRNHYKDDFAGAIKVFSLEQVLRVDIEGVPHCGALDLVVERNKAYEIWDHKTKSMKAGGSVDEWRTRFQFLLYTKMWNLLYAGNKARSFLVNIIKKPAISKKQGESMQGFFMRLAADINSRPSDYFQRERVPIDVKTMENFHNGFLRPRIDTMKMLQTIRPETREWNAMVLKRNSAACYSYGKQCSFYHHCHGGAKLSEMKHLVKRGAKHEHYDEKEF